MIAPTGVIRLSELASENGMRVQTLKRRLLRMDRSWAKKNPDGPFILVQHGDGAPYCADAAVLFLRARGYLQKRLEKQPLEEIRDLLLQIRDDQVEDLRETKAIRKEVATMRMRVA